MWGPSMLKGPGEGARDWLPLLFTPVFCLPTPPPGVHLCTSKSPPTKLRLSARCQSPERIRAKGEGSAWGTELMGHLGDGTFSLVLTSRAALEAAKSKKGPLAGTPFLRSREEEAAGRFSFLGSPNPAGTALSLGLWG